MLVVDLFCWVAVLVVDFLCWVAVLISVVDFFCWVIAVDDFCAPDPVDLGEDMESDFFIDDD